MSGGSSLDHPAATFHYFLGYPRSDSFPIIRNAKYGPSDHLAVILELFTDHLQHFFKRASDADIPPPTNWASSMCMAKQPHMPS